MAVVISVVIPVLNERETLAPLVARLRPVLDRLTAGMFEIVFVNDGSTDGSRDLLDRLHHEDPRLKVVHLSRNFGHQPALQAGLDRATGAAVVFMDADLQDRPEELESFVRHWREGYEVVYAVRTQRKEGILKRAAYAAFYRTFRAIADIDVPVDAGDFCLLDRRVVDALVAMPERNRLLRGLRQWVGFRQIGVRSERDVRHAGESKYTLRQLVRLALSGYFGFSVVPLRLATWLGFASAGVGFGMTLWVVLTKVLDIPSPRGWASTVATILLVGGLQMLVLGVLGEYLGRILDEVRARPLYVVESCRGFGKAAREPEAHAGSRTRSA
jgi:polyisoprenyl-phosphate glycosyltransferase